MKYCEKCGKEITDPSGECLICASAMQNSEEEAPKNTCVHCGAELAADAEVCMSCGCPVAKTTEQPVASATVAFPFKRKKLSVKQIVLMVAAAVAVIGVIVGGIFLWRHIRVQKIAKALEGETYRFEEWHYYTYIADTYNIKEMDFKDDMECEYYYYYSNIDAENEYTRTYSVRFRGEDVYIIMGIDEYEVDFDRHGDIVALIDTSNDEEFELQ